MPGHHALEPLRVGAVADGGDVVGQGVEPDVGDVAGVPRQRDAPAQRRAADREVLQARADEAEHLVALGLGLDEVGCCSYQSSRRSVVAGEPEEVVLLLQLDDGAAAGGVVPSTSSAR